MGLSVVLQCNLFRKHCQFRRKCNGKCFRNDLFCLAFISSTGIFGVDLTTSLGRGSSEVPAVVTECISEIEARGLMSEGIYRVPGSQDQVEALKLAFERGELTVCARLCW